MSCNFGHAAVKIRGVEEREYTGNRWAVKPFNGLQVIVSQRKTGVEVASENH